MRLAEDVNESSLNYAEIKALAIGNLLIKEQIDMDNEVIKIQTLKANYKSIRYQLEDKVAKTYPQEILHLEKRTDKMTRDIAQAEPLGTGNNRFTSLTIGAKVHHDKKEAGAPWQPESEVSEHPGCAGVHLRCGRMHQRTGIRIQIVDLGTDPGLQGRGTKGTKEKQDTRTGKVNSGAAFGFHRIFCGLKTRR